MKFMLECKSVRGDIKLAIKGTNEEEVKEYCYRQYTGVTEIIGVYDYDEYMKFNNPKTRQSSMASYTNNNMAYRKRGRLRKMFV